MHYTVYKTTNLINNKTYIGKHQTKDLYDNYLGSGKHLKRAIEKYGVENFKKEILFVFDNVSDMNAKEAELVTPDFLLREDTYNICVGGQGGFSHINDKSQNHLMTCYRGGKAAINKLNETKKKDPDVVKRMSEASRRNIQKYNNDPNAVRYIHDNTGFKFKEESKQKMSMSATGNKNSQYGTMWITDGNSNKKIKKEVDIIPDGWYKGRS